MSVWRKSPAELVALFDMALPADPRLERRKMFGYPCAFVNGNMYAGLHQENFILRLSAADLAEMKDGLGATTFEPMPGRPMREYVALPEAVLADRKALADWLGRGLDYVGSLPPKAPKARKKKAGAK